MKRFKRSSDLEGALTLKSPTRRSDENMEGFVEYLDIVNFSSLVGALGLGGAIGAAIIYRFIKSYLPSYLSEKAKNLASKEDIAAITDKVESVKSDYAYLLEEVRSNYQLKFAAVEREKIVKKEVYMDAVEAITRSQNMIMAFCNLDLSEKEITANMGTDAGKIAKVQVVGAKDTVKAVSEYMAEIGGAALDLMLKRSELVSRKNLIQINQNFRDKKQQEIEKYVEMMKNLNLQGNSDQYLWDLINRNLAFEQEQYNKYQEKIDSLQAVQNVGYLAFTRECMDIFFKISEFLPPAVFAVRTELDLDIVKEDYLDIFRKNNEKGKQVFESFLTRFEKMI